MQIISVLGIVFLAFVVTFLIASHNNKHDFIDITWGAGFVLGALASYAMSPHRGFVATMVTGLVTIWGLRLTYHLYRRNVNKPEDFRYQNYKDNYKGKYFNLYFFFRMYVLQYVLNIIILFPVVFTNLYTTKVWRFSWIGLIVWLIGFGFEVIGDYQLAQFKADTSNKGKIITKGLWRYTRHPNYFGEATLWWGIFLMCFVHFKLPYGWMLLSPITITVLVRYVSGVPMLEKAMEGRKGWQEYKLKTSVFIPKPPKS